MIVGVLLGNSEPAKVTVMLTLVVLVYAYLPCCCVADLL